MSLELTGVVVNVLPEQSGNGKKGVWRKQDIIVEIPGNFPKKVCISMWNDKIEQWGVRPGDNVAVSFDIESKEYNGRWYTEAKAWKIAKGQGASSQPAPAPMNEPYAPAPFEADGGDLPF